MLNPWGANNGPTDTYTGEYLIPEWAQSVDTRKGYLRVPTLEKHPTWIPWLGSMLMARILDQISVGIGYLHQQVMAMGTRYPD